MVISSMKHEIDSMVTYLGNSLIVMARSFPNSVRFVDNLQEMLG